MNAFPGVRDQNLRSRFEMKKYFLGPIFITAFILLAATAAFSQTTYSNIDQMSGWSLCSACAGANGTGPTATYSMWRVSSPSLDGSAAQLNLGGSTPYSNALYSKTLTYSSTTATNLHHFIYDLYFYYKNAPAMQALELNTSEYYGGKAFIFGIQCDVRSSGTWELSAPNYAYSSLSQIHWESTGIPCPAPPTYKWNHVTLEYERTSDGKVHYIALTFNGSKHYLNKYYYRRTAPSSWAGITTHIQLDGNYAQTDYSVWADKYKVTAW
jgi:hypothetical protein